MEEGEGTLNTLIVGASRVTIFLFQTSCDIYGDIFIRPLLYISTAFEGGEGDVLPAREEYLPWGSVRSQCARERSNGGNRALRLRSELLLPISSGEARPQRLRIGRHRGSSFRDHGERYGLPQRGVRMDFAGDNPVVILPIRKDALYILFPFVVITFPRTSAGCSLQVVYLFVRGAS